MRMVGHRPHLVLQSSGPRRLELEPVTADSGRIGLTRVEPVSEHGATVEIADPVRRLAILGVALRGHGELRAQHAPNLAFDAHVLRRQAVQHDVDLERDAFGERDFGGGRAQELQRNAGPRGAYLLLPLTDLARRLETLGRHDAAAARGRRIEAAQVVAQHALAVERRQHAGHRALAKLHPLRRVAEPLVARVVQRHDLVLQRSRTTSSNPAGRARPRRGRRARAVCPSRFSRRAGRRTPSAHQPSSTLKFTVPLIAAFMPEVPLASCGGTGVLSQMSTPDVSRRPRPMS